MLEEPPKKAMYVFLREYGEKSNLGVTRKSHALVSVTIGTHL